jgi:hypothetical protein
MQNTTTQPQAFYTKDQSNPSGVGGASKPTGSAPVNPVSSVDPVVSSPVNPVNPVSPNPVNPSIDPNAPLGQTSQTPTTSSTPTMSPATGNVGTMGSMPTSPTNQQPPTTKKKSNSMKNILAVAGLVLFIIVAIMGVLIAQRQMVRIDDEVVPVAPTAPVSEPEAAVAEDNFCVLPFTVPQGSVECVEKKLVDINSGITMPANGNLERGGDYEYRIKIRVNYHSEGDVYVRDLIPEAFEYVEPAVDTARYVVSDPVNGLLTLNLGTISSNDSTEIEVGFIVRLPMDAEPTTITNTARVSIGLVDTTSNCTITHQILPVGVAQCVSKEAFTTFGGIQIPEEQEVSPGDEFIYAITITAEETTVGPVNVLDQLPSELEFVVDPQNTPNLIYDSNNHRVAMAYEPMQSGQTEVLQFKVKLIDEPTAVSFSNMADVYTTNEEEGGETVHTCKLNLRIEKEETVYSCNSSCDNTAQCQTANSNYICIEDGGQRFCRLADNPDNLSCQPAQATPTPSPTPETTPAPGCNELCQTNADCSNINHVCLTTADGTNRCRLESYPDSTTCTVPVAQTQPVAPAELLVAGPADWLNWLKVGLITLGIGTALFLLL